MRNTFKILLSASLLLACSSAFAAVSPVAISIFAPAQFPPRSFDVAGVRASLLMGQHRNVYGIDLAGVGNITDGEMAGIAVAGGFNLNKGFTTIIGLQAAGIANITMQRLRVVGLQVAAANINHGDSSVIGLNLALINSSPYMRVLGLQAGLYNRAHTVSGFQIGVINDCEVLHGLQIGLLNFHRRGLFAVAPILNVGF
jgi:hypothetical protein